MVIGNYEFFYFCTKTSNLIYQPEENMIPVVTPNLTKKYSMLKKKGGQENL